MCKWRPLLRVDVNSLKDANYVFADSIQYSDDEIKGYWRIVKVLYYSKTFQRNSLYIGGLKQVIANLNLSEKQTIRLRFWDCESLTKVGEIIGFSKQRVGQIEKEALDKIKAQDWEFVIDKQITYYNQRIEFLQSLKSGKHYDIVYPIKKLNLSTRATKALDKNGISTIGQLLECSEEDLLDMENLGVGTVSELISRIQKNYPLWNKKLN